MKVLLATLNWGLGHATRDIPIIRKLLAKGAEVAIAGDGASLELLRLEFPELRSFELPAYNIRYSSGSNQNLKLLMQAPKVWMAIQKECKAVSAILAKEKFDVVISDNRLGCWSAKVKSVFITHQLQLMSSTFEGSINSYYRKQQSRFNEIWVPDIARQPGLAGILSHKDSVHSNIKYIGVLSRFERLASEETGKILALISGPEPQRSLLENELMNHLLRLDREVVLLRGLPEEGSTPIRFGNVCAYGHLPGKEIEKLIQEAPFVIARTGYTTLMDLSILGKKALLIPTPGQAEQEYLGEHCKAQGWWTIQQQGSIRLRKALDHLESMTVPAFEEGELLEDVIDSLGFKPSAT